LRNDSISREEGFPEPIREEIPILVENKQRPYNEEGAFDLYYPRAFHSVRLNLN
jgi:hypothetical protein